MENRDRERFFGELAKAYAENEGAALREELEAIKDSPIDLSGVDRKIGSKMARDRFRRYGVRALPLAASLVAVILLFNSYWGGKAPFDPGEPMASAPAAPAPAAPAAPSEAAPAPPTPAAPAAPVPPADPSSEIEESLRYSIEFVGANLPSGYSVTGVDYDNASAVMEITNIRRNNIVFLTEAYQDFDTDGFTEITINGSAAYGLVKNDYCVLKYRKGDMLYTFTGRYEFVDLVEISENIIEL